MNLPIWILAANLASTFCLVGLIWTIQVVHYPAFHFVDAAHFPEFESFHQKRIGFVVTPLMLVEMVTSLLLLWARPDFVAAWAAVCGGLLVVAIWLSTFALQVPLHGQLSKRMNAQQIQGLVATNWIRTLAWTGRGVLLLWVLLNALAGGNPKS